MSYNMSDKELELIKLANALVEAKTTLKKDKAEVHATNVKPSPNGKKKKKRYKGKALKPKGGKSNNKKAKDKYFYCKKEGYWKRNCHAFLATVKDKKPDDTEVTKEGVQGNKETGKK
ncbi:uncharacterized protein LOC122655221 [Telopea speciosissima]|uniref:uncharacterized protein LOC122655221 n=1 Tax=Telopea speciosissima TaxID=54955 RepID=UPI001CC38F58|nr:uncharacterized protein LOC122655221 [Telopea speciosissima]